MEHESEFIEELAVNLVDDYWATIKRATAVFMKINEDVIILTKAKNTSIKYTDIDNLRKIIRYHEYMYRVENMPEISDYEFDMLMKELERLEEESNEPIPADSPTQVVGSELMEFPE